MFIKTSAIVTLVALIGQAMTTPTPAPAAAANAPITTYGTVVAYPQTNYGGGSNAVVVQIVSGAATLCQIYSDFNTKARYPPIRSYLAANVSCGAFTSTDCSGPLTFITSGNKPDVNINVGSIACVYSNQ